MTPPALQVVRSRTKSPSPTAQDRTDASAGVEVIAENVKSPPLERDLAHKPFVGADVREGLVQHRGHGLGIDPAVLVDIGRAVRGIERPEMQHRLTGARAHPVTDIGRRRAHLPDENRVTEDRPLRLDLPPPSRMTWMSKRALRTGLRATRVPALRRRSSSPSSASSRRARFTVARAQPNSRARSASWGM